MPANSQYYKAQDIHDGYFNASDYDAEVEVFFVFGVSGIDRAGADANDPDNRGVAVFDADFDLSSEAAQQVAVFL